MQHRLGHFSFVFILEFKSNVLIESAYFLRFLLGIRVPVVVSDFLARVVFFAVLVGFDAGGGGVTDAAAVV